MQIEEAKKANEHHSPFNVARMLEWFRNLVPCRRINHNELKVVEEQDMESDKNIAIILEAERNGKVVIAKAEERRKALKHVARKEAEKEISRFREVY